MKVTFMMHFVEWMRLKNPEITEMELVEITARVKLPEQKNVRSVKRDASICLGLIYLYNPSIGDPHIWERFASRAHFHLACFSRRSKPIIVNLRVYSTCFPRVPEVDNNFT